MTIDDAIKKIGRYWHTGMDDYFTFDEILELEEMLKELKERREQEDKEDEERALEVERDDCPNNHCDERDDCYKGYCSSYEAEYDWEVDDDGDNSTIQEKDY